MQDLMEHENVLTCEERHLNNLLVKDDSPMQQVAMDGQEVFKFAARMVPKSITKSLMKQAFPKKKSNILYYIRLTKGSLKQQRED